MSFSLAYNFIQFILLQSFRCSFPNVETYSSQQPIFFTRGDIKSLQDILVRVKMRKRLKLVWVHPGPLIQFTLRRLLLLSNCVSPSLQYWKTSGAASKNVSSFVLKILLMHTNVFAVLKNHFFFDVKRWLPKPQVAGYNMVSTISFQYEVFT